MYSLGRNRAKPKLAALRLALKPFVDSWHAGAPVTELRYIQAVR